jgi:hypothetical protein
MATNDTRTKAFWAIRVRLSEARHLDKIAPSFDTQNDQLRVAPQIPDELSCFAEKFAALRSAD